MAEKSCFYFGDQPVSQPIEMFVEDYYRSEQKVTIQNIIMVCKWDLCYGKTVEKSWKKCADHD